MLRQLQVRAEDLSERLFVSELEMRRSRNLEKRMEAYRDFHLVIDQLDVLRRDAELLHGKETMLDRLDRKVVGILRSPAYRIAEWFAKDAAGLAWFIGPAIADPELRPC